MSADPGRSAWPSDLRVREWVREELAVDLTLEPVGYGADAQARVWRGRSAPFRGPLRSLSGLVLGRVAAAAGCSTARWASRPAYPRFCSRGEVRDDGAVTAQPPPRSSYSAGSTSNLVRSLLAVGGILVVFFFMVPRVSSVSQPPVDVESTARDVARSSGWAVSVPRGLPEGWQASAARFVRSTDGLMTWHAGYISPAGHYVALEQTQGSTEGWVEAETNRAARTGELMAAGRVWVKFNRDTKVQRSLLDRPEDPKALTTLITGDGTFEELVVLVDHLQPVSAG